MRDKILTINPGSTSTKLAVFCNNEMVLKKKIFHSVSEMSQYATIMDQLVFRLSIILAELAENQIKLNELICISARGGLLHPLTGGTYEVNDAMIKDLWEAEKQHASNLGAVIAKELADQAGIKAYIVDPVTVDEREPIARLSGLKGIERTSLFHALNHKAVGRKAAQQLQKKYEDCSFVIAHMGGGFSIGAHYLGNVIDNSNGLDSDGPFTPERSGCIPIIDLLTYAKENKLDEAEIKKLIVGNGGLVSYLGTNDARKVEQLIAAGDEYAELSYQAMAYQVAKEVGSYATVLKGKIDAILLTGGVLHSVMFAEWIKERVKWIAPVYVFPGEAEMEALYLGVLRVFEGKETAKIYQPEHEAIPV